MKQKLSEILENILKVLYNRQQCFVRSKFCNSVRKNFEVYVTFFSNNVSGKGTEVHFTQQAFLYAVTPLFLAPLS